MTLRTAMTTGLLGLFCIVGMLVWTGCDTASSNEALVISPSSVTLSSGQSQTFTVSGGYHYTWSLGGGSNSMQGSLSSTTGSQVLYTAPTSETLSGSVVIHVVSTIEGSGASTSNSPAYSVSADAIVTFK